MAGNGKRGGGDRILESRHLVGLFLGVVLLCGVFFTLGYVMGRTQYGGAVHAADAPPKLPTVNRQPPSKEPPTTSKTGDGSGWDFDPGKPADKHLESPAPVKTPAPVLASPNKSPGSIAGSSTKAVNSKEPPRFQPPALG